MGLNALEICQRNLKHKAKTDKEVKQDYPWVADKARELNRLFGIQAIRFFEDGQQVYLWERDGLRSRTRQILPHS